MLVEQLMNRPPITCTEDDSCREAARLMWEHDCGALPVIDEDGALCGIVTDRDICMSACLREASLGDIQVRDVMARDLLVCRPGDPIGVGERIMSQYQVRRLPVVDSARRVVGVISVGDLAREAEQEAGRRHPDVSDVDVSRTLAAICQPRRREALVTPH